MELTAKLFHENKRTIYDQSYKVVRKYGAWDEKEDVQANAMLIFCESVSSFDPAMGANFNTHLSHNLGALTRKYDPRSKACQVLATNLSMSTPMQSHSNSSGDGAMELEDKLGNLDANVSTSELWDFLAKIGDQDLCDLAFEVVFGELDRKICRTTVITWGAEKKGWKAAQSLKKRQDLINTMKLWLKISQS